MLTPETYWYPVEQAYSGLKILTGEKQTYFSNYRLKVKPLPGVSSSFSRAGKCDEEGVYSFKGDYPSQTLSLVIGDYQQKSAYGTAFFIAFWHLRDHDYFTASFDSIHDTIPWLIRNVKEQLARQYKLDYPFKRFSIVEVPVQFASYERAWSQAQETVQPEMVLFPEKGAIFWELDVKRQVKNHIRWSGNNEISLQEAPDADF